MCFILGRIFLDMKDLILYYSKLPLTQENEENQNRSLSMLNYGRGLASLDELNELQFLGK